MFVCYPDIQQSNNVVCHCCAILPNSPHLDILPFLLLIAHYHKLCYYKSGSDLLYLPPDQKATCSNHVELICVLVFLLTYTSPHFLSVNRSAARQFEIESVYPVCSARLSAAKQQLFNFSLSVIKKPTYKITSFLTVVKQSESVLGGDLID